MNAQKKFSVAVWYQDGTTHSGHVIARDRGAAVDRFLRNESRRLGIARGRAKVDDVRPLLAPDGIRCGPSIVPMTRAEQIEAGVIWQVHRGAGAAAELLYEGKRASCEAFMRAENIFRDWQNGRGEFSLGQLIWEKSPGF